jgi:hypothetical protein
MPRKIRILKAKGIIAKGKAGRPPHPIDWDRVVKMTMAGATGASIAHELGVLPALLYDRCQSDQGMNFTNFQILHRMRGDDMLKLKQFELAMKGDKSMLIWLGKNRLKQRDRQEFTTEGGAPIPVINVQVLPPSNAGGK